jgi:hypothetical protein
VRILAHVQLRELERGLRLDPARAELPRRPRRAARMRRMNSPPSALLQRGRPACGNRPTADPIAPTSPRRRRTRAAAGSTCAMRPRPAPLRAAPHSSARRTAAAASCSRPTSAGSP